MLTEITVDGRVYVDKSELVDLIRTHKRNAKEGKEPGFIEKNEGKRNSAFMALNHLQAEVCAKEAMESAQRRIEKMKKQRVIVAFAKDKDGAQTMQYFSAWIKMKPDLPEKVRTQLKEIGLKEEESAPMFASDWNDAMVFTDPEFAKIQAERVKAFFNDDDTVIAVSYFAISTNAGRRLLEALFMDEEA